MYVALDRLSGQGLIEVDREEVVDSRLRRYYRLTSEGSERLAQEAARLVSHGQAAIARLERAPVQRAVIA